MLLEEGFEVQSADISDKMLKQAYKTRWERRKEDLFDQWGRKIVYYLVKYERDLLYLTYQMHLNFKP